MTSQILLPFEQATLDSAQAEKAATAAAKLAAQVQAQLELDSRRRHREAARLDKTPDQVAMCGINWYCRSPRNRAHGGGWTHCHTCGRLLTYWSTHEEAEKNRTPPDLCRKPTRRSSTQYAEANLRRLYEHPEPTRATYRDLITLLTPAQLRNYAAALASIHRRIVKAEALPARLERFDQPEAPLDLGHPADECLETA